MVLTTTQPTSSPAPFDDKENTVIKPYPAPRPSHTRRPRSRPTNSPSPVVLAREAARDPGRRRTQSPPVLPSPVLQPSIVPRANPELADVEMSDATSLNQNNIPPLRLIRLPRYLGRPSFRPIAPEAIDAVEPDLKEVALEYIYDILGVVGEQMLRVTSNIAADPPRNRLVRELDVTINDISAESPTHLFAVHTKNGTRVTLHPAHSIILALHCAHLPPLPPSTPTTPTEAGKSIVLPVVPLCIPSPATFPILLQYLYTKRVERLLAILPRLPPRDTQMSAEELTQALAKTFTSQALLSHAAQVHGLWGNACALGIFDKKLWGVIEMAWSVLLNAIALSTGATWKAETLQPEERQEGS